MNPARSGWVLAVPASQLRRLRAMLAKAGEGPKPAASTDGGEPLEHRLRFLIWRGWEFRTGARTGFLAAKAWAWGQKAERELAAIEERPQAPWAELDTPAPIAKIEKPAGPTKAGLAMQQRLEELARAHHKGVKPPAPPESRDVPEAAA